MATVPTIEEMEDMKDRMEKFRDLVKDDRKEAIRILHSAGIVDKRGKFTAPYRVRDDR
jgi:hypothetical protein